MGPGFFVMEGIMLNFKELLKFIFLVINWLLGRLTDSLREMVLTAFYVLLFVALYLYLYYKSIEHLRFRDKVEVILQDFGEEIAFIVILLWVLYQIFKSL